MIRGVLFDNDGTLVDTYDLMLASFVHATKKVLGRDIPEEELMAGVGMTLEAQMQMFSDDPMIQERLTAEYREHNHSVHDDVIKAFPGLLESLARLQNAGLKLGVVTSKRHALAWRGLEIVGAAPYLQCMVGAEDCEENKPESGPILKGLELLGLVPEECFYVGDSPFDIQAGNAAGCPTVAVTWGVFAEDVLRAENPSYVVKSFEELEALCLP